MKIKYNRYLLILGFICLMIFYTQFPYANAQSTQPGDVQGQIASCGFHDGFEAGNLGTNWKIYTTNEGRVRVSTSYPQSGRYAVLLDDNTNNSTYSTSAIILPLNLSGQSQVELNFWWREFGDENHSADGVFFSDNNGLTWRRAFSFNNGPSTFKHEVIDIDAVAAANNLILNNQFQIKFQFYDNYSVPTDGYAIDEVRVNCTGSYIIYLPGIVQKWSPPPPTPSPTPPTYDWTEITCLYALNWWRNDSPPYNIIRSSYTPPCLMATKITTKHIIDGVGRQTGYQSTVERQGKPNFEMDVTYLFNGSGGVTGANVTKTYTSGEQYQMTITKFCPTVGSLVGYKVNYKGQTGSVGNCF